MKTDEIVALFARRTAAFAHHDVVELASSHAEGAVLLSPTARIITGRDAIEKVYRVRFAAFADLENGSRRSAERVRAGLARVRSSGTRLGGPSRRVPEPGGGALGA